MTTDDALAVALKAHYGAAARRAAQGTAPDECCSQECGDAHDVFGAGLYGPDARAELPDEAIAGSIGCANPVALA
ncbi:MAG TPA: hypothetical protein VF015_14245, partial [Acidimicrobiales bacterium]